MLANSTRYSRLSVLGLVMLCWSCSPPAEVASPGDECKTQEHCDETVALSITRGGNEYGMPDRVYCSEGEHEVRKCAECGSEHPCPSGYRCAGWLCVPTVTNDAGTADAAADVACTEATDCVSLLAAEPDRFANPAAAYCESPGTTDARCVECDAFGRSYDCPTGYACADYGGCQPYECQGGTCGPDNDEEGWTCGDDGRCGHPNQEPL